MLNDQKLIIGWSEWCSLPELKIPVIKAKIDTGAKTSAIHAFNLQPMMYQGKYFVNFDIHPLQGNSTITIPCKAMVVDIRVVMSSNGHKEHRYVITTPLILGQRTWEIELTLSNRDPLKFRMLLGREALSNRIMIDPGHKLLLGKMSRRQLENLYFKF